MKTKSIYDLVYLDFNKAGSIYSQLQGGLIEQIQSVIENTDNISPSVGFDIKFLKAQLSGDSQEKISQLEIKNLHHDLLIRLENELTDMGVLIDLNDRFSEDADIEFIRSSIGECHYIKAEGWSTIEDYERINKIANKFNDISRFIKECQINNESTPDEIKRLSNQIQIIKKTVDAESNPAKKQKELVRLKKIQDEFDKIINTDNIPEYFVEGIQLFINTFLPGRINFRVYPFENHPSFQLFANLKRDCFIDTDIENLIFSYGSTPNVKLTIIGLITSMPNKKENKFDPLQEFDIEPNQTNEQIFEKAFRGVFKGFEGFESFVRYSRYPNITITPIAVYRTIKSKK